MSYLVAITADTSKSVSLCTIILNNKCLLKINQRLGKLRDLERSLFGYRTMKSSMKMLALAPNYKEFVNCVEAYGSIYTPDEGKFLTDLT